MHEYSLFLSLLRSLEELLAPFENPKIEGLTLGVGTYSGIDISYLERVLETFKEGTLIESAKIVIEEDPLCIFCFTCEREFQLWDKRAQCPQCQGFEVKITGGLDLTLKRVELEDEKGS